MELVNAGKYTSTIVVTTLSFFQKGNVVIFRWWLFFYIFASLYSYAWDIRKDWGFLSSKSKYIFLRKKLYYPQVSFYYIAIICNLILRFTWTLTISPDSLNNLLYAALITTTLGILETFRRTLWNYFRVELENLKFE